MGADMKNASKEVYSTMIRDNQTWNTCSDCGKDWCDEVPTRGLLHRTRLCDNCAKKKQKKIKIVKKDE